jgi:hypothetical protein
MRWGWTKRVSDNIQFIGNPKPPLLSLGGFIVKSAYEKLSLIQTAPPGVSPVPSQFGIASFQGR